MADVWFGPAPASDMLRLFTEPDAWVQARDPVHTFLFYSQNIIYDEPNEHTGPNVYPALVDVGAFRKLGDWGIGIAIEAGTVKPERCDGLACLSEALTDIQKVEDAGGRVRAIVIDEPLVSAFHLGCLMTLEQAADVTAEFIKAVRARGVEDVTLTEAYPSARAGVILEFLRALATRGAQPSAFHLDVDRYGVKDKKIKEPVLQRELHTLQLDAGVPLGMIAFGQRVTTEAAYRADVVRWVQQVRQMGLQPARWIVQSWESRGPTGPKDLPRNLPESDPTSHTGLLLELAGCT